MNAGVGNLPEKLGRYLIIEEVGRGAMGVVYKAMDETMKRTVAVKVLAPDQADFAEVERRFLNEIEIAGRLNHPNIVSVYDVGHEAGFSYIVMEYVSRGTLRNLLSSRMPIHPSVAVDISMHVARALGHAHERGVLHLDVKPSNVLMSGDCPKLSDFGISVSMHCLPDGRHRAIEMLGSPAYVSPERVLGIAVDCRSDIFSLGVMLYEMVTARRPFEGRTIRETLNFIVHAPFTPPTLLEKRLPREFNFVIAKALAKSPKARYASASDFISDLHDLKAILPACETGFTTAISGAQEFEPGKACVIRMRRSDDVEYVDRLPPVPVALDDERLNGAEGIVVERHDPLVRPVRRRGKRFRYQIGFHGLGAIPGASGQCIINVMIKAISAVQKEVFMRKHASWRK